MSLLTSIFDEKFKKNFFVLFVLSSTIPLLLMICIIYLSVIPKLLPEQITDLKTVFAYGVLLMLLPVLLSFFLGSKWVGSVESISHEIQSKSIQVMGEQNHISDDNEFSVIHQSFNDLHNELQNKMNKLNEVSKKLIDSNLKLKELATTDDLTSLYNRRHFDQRLAEETSRCDRHKQDLSLIMIDFDDFKKHNDTHGHQTGDKLLGEMADIIRQSIRQSDMVFRYGGDEFAILVPGCDIQKAAFVAKGLAKKVSKHPFKNHEGEPLERITISCGVSFYEGNRVDFVAKADRHLFAAKTEGKGVVVAQT
ncbi:MAG: GGDEF domain-containing protein [Desulfobacterales bacterium]|nr:MAG: GGDEF domain-containing protein [Desulfobacterales bacterium]